MAYFSNGSEGEMFQAQNCYKGCVHWKADELCPVWAAHLMYVGPERDEVRDLLSYLIPEWEMGERGAKVPTCAMFHAEPATESTP